MKEVKKMMMDNGHIEILNDIKHGRLLHESTTGLKLSTGEDAQPLIVALVEAGYVITVPSHSQTDFQIIKGLTSKGREILNDSNL